MGHFIFLCYKHGMSSRDALMDAVNKLPFLFELKYHLVKDYLISSCFVAVKV